MAERDVWQLVERLRSEEPRPGDPEPSERPDPEGRFYRLDELDGMGQGDLDVQRAYAAEIVGFTLYRDDGTFLPFGPDGQPRIVKAVFADYDFSFVKPGPQGLLAIEKADLPLPVLELAVDDGYATLADLAAAYARREQERPQLGDLERDEDGRPIVDADDRYLGF